jgi:CTP-dependent riboflavin kinase
MNILECGIVLPEIENYPKNVVEVIAAVNLREKFRLKDGDTVEVGIILS